MDSVGVRELRQNLSVYLRRIEKGETLRVTEHGRPVALLTPIRHTGDDVLDELEAQGLLERPRSRRRPLPPPVPLLPGEPTLSEVLQQMRDEDDR
ncbi:MAG TPA: type II toxin-antitoxin system prevent-host-death family antitoxin [Mycobacteriales bacterium]|nr:type II toxin-antitoxin system prevent-host-death family antitoxin [Mycobacteriales bacterium]